MAARKPAAKPTAKVEEEVELQTEAPKEAVELVQKDEEATVVDPSIPESKDDAETVQVSTSKGTSLHFEAASGQALIEILVPGFYVNGLGREVGEQVTVPAAVANASEADQEKSYGRQMYRKV